MAHGLKETPILAQTTVSILGNYHCEKKKITPNGQTLMTSLYLALPPLSHVHVICAFFPSPVLAP